MTFFEMLDAVLLGPLKLVFEMIFSVAWDKIGDPGLAIIVLSFCMNLLLMPLYKRADVIQIEARDTEARMKPVSDHIKKTFTGDERMMLMQTHYRQNNYSPLSALNGSVSLLLEIPFFMAAYQFLSNLEVLNGVSFGPIADLSQPDGLIKLGAVSVNFLPVLMTLINVVSSTLYLKGFPLKTKIQLYGMALVFLVLLYDSPSALVFYWTLNNTFSLCKTLFSRFPHAAKFGWNLKQKKSGKEPKTSTGMYLCGALFLTILVGFLIPSTYTAASPLEFVDVFYFYHPAWFIVRTGCMAAGVFLVWMSVFYWLASPVVKKCICTLVWLLSGITLVDYMFFGRNLGILNANLTYESGLWFSGKEKLINTAVVLVLAILMYLIQLRWPHLIGGILLTGVIVISGMSSVNTAQTIIPVNNTFDDDDLKNEMEPHFELSKDGENVVVIMLDRAMGQFLPYIFNEKPELCEKFAGFTYYSNTVSFGGFTNFASPALFGGYEYTPVELNKRDSESLESKQNEALKIMPVLFSENGYDVTVFDPPYASYQWIADLSIYDEYPEIRAYNTIGAFDDQSSKALRIDNNNRNFFCFSLMKSMPVAIQSVIYDGGRYNQAIAYDNLDGVTAQVNQGISVAQGNPTFFLRNYNVLLNMQTLTHITDGAKKNFLMMSNKTTHEPALLQEPEYVPAEQVDNTQYDMEHANRFTLDGRTIEMSEFTQLASYQVNVAALQQIANWLDYLRTNDVYDNTRIILVSDHGRQLYSMDELAFANQGEIPDSLASAELFYPLLMVKDFGSDTFQSSDAFMTNADVPTIAFKDIIENPVNPFTGNPITDSEKTAHDQYIIVSEEWDVEINDGNTFLPAYWAKISDDLWKKENWAFYDTETVLKEHAFP